jgi:large subunit ribosomal protein L18
VAVNKRILKRASRRAFRVRQRIKRDTTLPRVSVFRSLNQIYAQVIDDAQHNTLTSCSSLEVEIKGDKKNVAHAVGIELAKRMKEKGIEAAVFDRGQYLYHGRVKALADGLRESGLRI